MSDFYQLMARCNRSLGEMDKTIAEMERRNKIGDLETELWEARQAGDTRRLEQLRLELAYYERQDPTKKVEPVSTRMWQGFKESDFAWAVRGQAQQLVMNLLTLALYMIGIAGLVYLSSCVFG